jgi:hypothetical protein
MPEVTGLQLKIEGMELATSKYQPDFYRAQLVAQFLGMAGELVDADMVRETFFQKYNRHLRIGNAMGSLFLNKRWEWSGFTRSTRLGSHARTIRTWRLKEHYRRALP